MTEIRLWSRVRSPEEIKRDRDRRLNPSEQRGLVGYWRCEKGSGQTLRDFARDHSGTIRGAGEWASGEHLTLYRPLDKIIQVEASPTHSVVLRHGGSVWAWGENTFGQLGDGTTTHRRAPVLVRTQDGPYLTSIASVAVGRYHTLALAQAGTVLSWGSGSNGQLGHGDQQDRPFPAEIEGLPYITAIAAGDSHSLALAEDGVLYVWGRNHKGQLGNGQSDDCATPIALETEEVTEITAIAAGAVGQQQHHR
ncbi:hypothetical protein C2W62_38565 [Candidatus Entotheonella serta]|nr:hypothetical protein C2W62_38565 [Candidatus Entotheonella serta]